jgi:fructose-specific phosphotransferase system IIA component
MNLIQILQPGCIKIPLEGKDKNTVISELVDVLDANHLLTDKNNALDAVMQRERTRSTGIGSGIAIPHGKCTAVKELVMSLGITKQPIDFESIDGKPVRIVLLLISPINQTGPHIQALAKISRLMIDEAFKVKLEKCTSPEQAYDLIGKKENQ